MRHGLRACLFLVLPRQKRLKKGCRKADAKSKNIGKENCFNPSHAKYWAGNHARKGRDGEAADKKGKI